MCLKDTSASVFKSFFYYTSCIHFHSNQITLQVLKGQYYNIQILNSHISTFEHFEVNHQQEKSFHLYSNQSLFEVWNKFRICLSNEPFNHYSDLIHGFSSWCFCVCLFYVPDYFSREEHLSFKLRIQSNWTEFTDWWPSYHLTSRNQPTSRPS